MQGCYCLFAVLSSFPSLRKSLSFLNLCSLILVAKKRHPAADIVADQSGIDDLFGEKHRSLNNAIEMTPSILV